MYFETKSSLCIIFLNVTLKKYIKIFQAIDSLFLIKYNLFVVFKESRKINVDISKRVLRPIDNFNITSKKLTKDTDFTGMKRNAPSSTISAPLGRK